jgi:hypothetical protein
VINENSENWADGWTDFRDFCPSGIPSALWKSTYDPWIYFVKLRTGELLQFESATINDSGQWVHLSGVVHHGPFPNYPDDFFSFGRGMDVRIADIVWCVDGDS